MNNKKGKIDSSQDSDSDMALIEDETSKDLMIADLKCFESPALRNAARKVAEAARAIAKAKAKEAALAAATLENDIEDRDNTRKNLNTMGNEPLTNGDINMDGTIDANDTPIKIWWNKIRYISGMSINDKRVQFAIVTMILINAIMMGVATYPIVKDNTAMAKRFDVTDDVFLGIFTLELLLQMIYHGTNLLKDGWLVFDLIVILLSWAFYVFPAVRLIRIFRAFRIVTRVKIMKDLILGKQNLVCLGTNCMVSCIERTLTHHVAQISLMITIDGNRMQFHSMKTIFLKPFCRCCLEWGLSF
jgi:hypothetical protein